MRWETESNFLRACWLDRLEARCLFVRDVGWKEGRLYVFVRKIVIKGRVLGGERVVPVVPGREHAVLRMIEGRDPEERVFTHLPRRREFCTLRRQYGQGLYRSSAPGRKLPAPNKRHLSSPDDYDEAAAKEVAKALGRSDLDIDHVVRFSICGRNATPK